MASVSDTLAALLERATGPILIGKPRPQDLPPNSGPVFFVSSEHFIPTGPTGNNITVKIQAVGSNVVDALNEFVIKFDSVDKLKIAPPGPSGVLVPRPGTPPPRLRRN